MAVSVRFLSLAILATSITLVGCGRTITIATPKVYPAKGTVKFANGQPVANGAIEFRSKNDPTLTMMSVIADDGTFELFTIHANDRLPGALPGPCQVTVHPPPKDLGRPIEPFRVPNLITIEPKDNTFDIVIGSGFKSQ